MIVAYVDAGDIEKPLAQDMMKLFQDKNILSFPYVNAYLPPQGTESLLKSENSSAAQYADKFRIE
tara:strand:- start:57 stop:251 length:195 start_codon:yes stop_codon:yes gene_type:complete